MLRNIPRWLIGLNAATLIVAFIGVLLTRNTEFAFYLVSLLVIIAVVLWLHRRIVFSTPVLVALSIWSLAHLAGGLVPIPESWPHDGETAVLYSLWLIPDWLKYDNPVHAFGFGTCVAICHQGLRSVIGKTANHGGLIFLCLVAACGLGSLNEIIEFAATQISPETNVGGYVNTCLDLVANLVGASIVATYLGWRSDK